MKSFPLDRCRGLAGDVVDHAVDLLHFIDDAAADLVEDFVGDGIVFGGHGVLRGDGAQADHVAVGAFVAHDADGADVREGGEGLPDLAREAGFFEFFAVDGVGLPEDVAFFLGDFTEDADAEAGAGEGVAPDEGRVDAELEADFADFVFEEFAQRLEDFQGHVFRQAAYVVVALDDGGIGAAAAFDDVGVDGALAEVVDVADFGGFFFEDADEFFADDFAFALGVGDAGEFAEEAVFGVDADEVHGEGFFEDALDHVAFVFAHQAVVDEDAGELVADGFVNEDGGHRAVDAAGEGADDFLVTDGLADFGDFGVDEGVRGPVGLEACSAQEEVLDDLGATDGVHDFGMKLQAIAFAGRVFKGSDRAVGGGGGAGEAFRQGLDLVGMAHPADVLRIDVLEEGAVAIADLGLAVFAFLRFFQLATEGVGHELGAVADA